MKNKVLKYPKPSRTDPMDFVLRFHQALFCDKLFSPIVYGSCFLYAAVGVVSTMHLYISDGITSLKKYSVVPSTIPWAIATALTEYYCIQPAVVSYFNKEHYWDVSSASSQKRVEMQNQIRLARSTCFLFILQSSINSIFGFFIGYHSDIRSDLHSCEKIFGDSGYLKMFIVLVLNISHSVVTLISISIYLVLKYFTTTAKIQLQLLADFLEKVKVYGRSENENIGKHLKICSKQHGLLLDQFAMVQAITLLPLIPCSAGGSTAIIGCLTCIYYNRNIEDIVYMVLLLSLVGMIMLDCCQSGQDLDDAFAEFSTKLTTVEWYEWNEVNKKILLFMLMRSQKGAQIKVVNITFNRTLIIQILKAAYQIMVVLKGRI